MILFYKGYYIGVLFIKKYMKTENMQNDLLFVMRHSCAHVVAAAIEKLYPGTKFGVGPVIENGFYYDVETPEPIGEEDLKNIETTARKLIAQGHDFVRKEMSIEDGIKLFLAKGQDYKVSLLKDLKERGTTKINPDEMQDISGSLDTISVYETGDFIDLCRGPHVENTKQIGVFTLNKLAGAYWRGDQNNPQLQRVYGVCFSTKEELNDYLEMLEEAKKRDHRKIGKELDLFTFSDLVGTGLPLWTPKGTILRNILDNFIWELRRDRGYERVSIPHITKKELYETSGHWEKFSDGLFKITTREGHEFAMKPMNCPHHTQIFARTVRSYRDMPQRYAETTTCYRDEQTGELHGISRTRAFSQDDAHVFCRESQVKDEFLKIWDIIDIFYPVVGFDELSVRLSLHDPSNFEAYLGTPELWKKAENSIRELAQERGVDYIEQIGEAAFYGPKVDFIAKDSIGREWQVATIQLDINLPDRFDLYCINEKGENERIVMVHAAIMGSIERFLSIFIEHHAGAFPLWLSPEQIRFVAVSEKFVDIANSIANEFNIAGLRASVDNTDESVGKKIRSAVKQKVPYVVVIGDKEANGEPWNIRVRGKEDQETMEKSVFLSKVLKEVEEKIV